MYNNNVKLKSTFANYKMLLRSMREGDGQMRIEDARMFRIYFKNPSKGVRLGLNNS